MPGLCRRRVSATDGGSMTVATIAQCTQYTTDHRRRRHDDRIDDVQVTKLAGSRQSAYHAMQLRYAEPSAVTLAYPSKI